MISRRIIAALALVSLAATFPPQPQLEFSWSLSTNDLQTCSIWLLQSTDRKVWYGITNLFNQTTVTVAKPSGLDLNFYRLEITRAPTLLLAWTNAFRTNRLFWGSNLPPGSIVFTRSAMSASNQYRVSVTGSNMLFAISSVDTNGNEGDWSPALRLTIKPDPPKPTLKIRLVTP